MIPFKVSCMTNQYTWRVRMREMESLPLMFGVWGLWFAFGVASMMKK